MNTNAVSALIVGNFLSESRGIRCICEDLAARLSAAGCTIVTTSSYESRALRLWDMLRTVVQEKHKYRVANVEVYSDLAFIWAEAVCFVLRRLGKPYLLTLHGGNLPRFASRNPRRVARLLASAAAVTTPSGFLLNEFRSFRSDIILLPNPLQLNAYPFRRRRPVRPNIVWLRAFHGMYNPLLALQVLARVVRQFPAARLTMIGPVKEERSLEEFRARMNKLNLTERVHIAGAIPKSKVPEWLDDNDIFLNTTNVDNTPVSVMEAMACGLCVVSTSVGGMPYLVKHERDGLLFPAGDPDAAARAVCRLLSDPLLAENLARNGRSYVERFDWSIILPQWQELLSSVPSGKQPDGATF
jgi:glycosyltransferase involved in cell wall biosynthesis